jgi:hypothetical protein
MANEAVLIHETELPIPMTCANGTGIERGALLKLSDPMTAAAITTSTDAVAGVCAVEKIASDGNTKVPVYRRGVFKVTASGAITVGEVGVFNNNNTVERAGAGHEMVAGIALETAADGETFLFELFPYNVNHA